jgi:uncharacterized membrane protein (DUF373 family)
MIKTLRHYQKIMITVVTVMMGVVLVLAVIDLGWMILKDVFTPPIFLLDIDELIDIFGLFLLVVIGVELLESLLTTYLTPGKQHYEVVLLVALIAMARKVIILDVHGTSGVAVLGIAAVIVALTVGFYLMKKSLRLDGRSSEIQS